MRLLLPRQHGAYAQLLFPLASALLAAPGGAAWQLAGAALALFLAFEPLAVLTGDRGLRARRELGGRAVLQLAALLVAAVALAAAALLPPAPVTLALAGAVGLFGALNAAVVLRRGEMTLASELLTAITLPAAAAPVASAGGAPLGEALLIAAIFIGGYVTIALAVNGLIGARSRGSRRRPLVTLVAALSVTGFATLAARGGVSWGALVAALPLTAVGVALAYLPLSPRQLIVIGWALVAASLLTCVLLRFA